jgi:16S rRNA (guanine1516-N2)-methyltransferase
MLSRLRNDFHGKVVVLYEGNGDVTTFQLLAERLSIPLINNNQLVQINQQQLFLTWRNGCLKLIDRGSLKKGGLVVDFDVRSEQQRSWPAPRKGPLAQAIGRKTRTVVDATTGWGKDSFYIFRMGYDLHCIERSAIMVELLKDGLQRLSQQSWMITLGIIPPRLLAGNAIELLPKLEPKPDCIYLDPMFPPKRKKSALARKSMLIMRGFLGSDDDREELFNAAIMAAGKRVVVKCPDYAEPLGGKACESFAGKLVRYDVYLKST